MQAGLIALVLVLQFCLVQLDNAVICESAGHCVETARHCVNDDESVCCPPLSIPTISASYETSTVRDESIKVSYRSCVTNSGWSSMNRTDMALESELTLDYSATSPKHMSVCVSWTLTESSGRNGGFEVRLLKRYKSYNNPIYHFCVMDSSQRKLCINNLEYELIYKDHLIEVFPYPLAPDDNIQTFSKTVTLRRDIAGCADIKQIRGACGPKSYKASENVVMRSCLHKDGTKDLAISWDRPSGADAPAEVYFLYIDGGERIAYFKVKNTTRVTLKNMNSSLTYSVEVQAYRYCAGLGNYYVSDRFGCGAVSNKVTETSAECPLQNLTITDALISSTLSTLRNQLNHSVHHEDAPSLSGIVLYLTLAVGTLAAGVVAAVVLTAMLYAGVRIFKHFRTTSLMKVLIYPEPVQNTKVLVFYAPSMTEGRLKSLQEQLVFPLLQYFDVVTPNDIGSGNISIWLEDVMKSVDSIFLVGNKEFCCDWMKSKEERSPVMNSLELLISSAAAQDTISRFGFVSAEDSIQDVFIPDNSYLKVMPVFLLGQKTCDIDKLYQFVTKSRGIEFRTGT